MSTTQFLTPPSGFGWVYTCICGSTSHGPLTLHEASEMCLNTTTCAGLQNVKCRVNDWFTCSRTTFICGKVRNEQCNLVKLPSNPLEPLNIFSTLALVFNILGILFYTFSQCVRQRSLEKSESKRNSYYSASLLRDYAAHNTGIERKIEPRQKVVSSRLSRALFGRTRPNKSESKANRRKERTKYSEAGTSSSIGLVSRQEATVIPVTHTAEPETVEEGKQYISNAFSDRVVQQETNTAVYEKDVSTPRPPQHPPTAFQRKLPQINVALEYPTDSQSNSESEGAGTGIQTKQSFVDSDGKEYIGAMGESRKVVETKVNPKQSSSKTYFQPEHTITQPQLNATFKASVNKTVVPLPKDSRKQVVRPAMETTTGATSVYFK